MQLDELIPLDKYNQTQGLACRETLAKALAGQIDVYYIYDRWSKLVYTVKDDLTKDKADSEALPRTVEYIHDVGDTIKLTEKYIKALWWAETNTQDDFTFEDFFMRGEPEDLVFTSCLREQNEETITDNIFVDPKPPSLKRSQKSPDNTLDKPSSTALKVIGLLMHHLAKSPKYASGASPNKSQIKELLLELASELNVNSYGLSKIDERLLADAMKYLEEQKL